MGVGQPELEVDCTMRTIERPLEPENVSLDCLETRDGLNLYVNFALGQC